MKNCKTKRKYKGVDPFVCTRRELEPKEEGIMKKEERQGFEEKKRIREEEEEKGRTIPVMPSIYEERE